MSTEESRAHIEQKFVDAHTEWMRENAAGLRIFDIARSLAPRLFADEKFRDQTLRNMGTQLALDAFRRGMGLIALAPPQYRVESFLGAWEGVGGSRPVGHESLIGPERVEWLTEPPPAHLIDPWALIQIKIEAFGFPIGPREV